MKNSKKFFEFFSQYKMEFYFMQYSNINKQTFLNSYKKFHHCKSTFFN